MFSLLAPIRVTDPGERDGILKGYTGDCEFEVRLARNPVSYGLDPDTLYKRGGRITRLVLYRPLNDSFCIKVAAFDRGWLYGRRQHLGAVRRIVDYLERREGDLS
jgi:hypothetical protein